MSLRSLQAAANASFVSIGGYVRQRLLTPMLSAQVSRMSEPV
jgi:hypothetical protein